MTTLADEALERSVELLLRASSPRGYLASPEFDHYAQMWSRDAAISSLGALVSGDDRLISGAIRTLESMSATATHLGQIAAVIHVDDDAWDWGEGGVVDATAWYVILAGAVFATTRDTAIARNHWGPVAKAMNWLRHQDVTGTGLVSSAPSTDWMDSSLVRSGRTLNLNALYHWAALAAERLARVVGAEPPVDPTDLEWRINTLFWPDAEQGPEELMTGLPRAPRRFPHSATVRAHGEAAARPRKSYVSHVIHSHYDEHCDVLANTILVCTGVADATRSTLILNHLTESGIDQPHPSRVWITAIDTTRPSSMFVPGIEVHLDPRWSNKQGAYHNGGAWPYVGGFRATALALTGRTEAASALLDRLALANSIDSWGFHEWFHGVTGEPGGARSQTWNAGAYLLAERAVRDPGSVAGIFR